MFFILHEERTSVESVPTFFQFNGNPPPRPYKEVPLSPKLHASCMLEHGFVDNLCMAIYNTAGADPDTKLEEYNHKRHEEEEIHCVDSFVTSSVFRHGVCLYCILCA